MKKIFLAVSLMVLVSCTSGKAPLKKMVADTCIQNDTTIQQKAINDSTKHLIDSLRTKLFLANYKVEQIKFYVKLCDKKKSQKVFLLGWLHRVLD